VALQSDRPAARRDASSAGARLGEVHERPERLVVREDDARGERGAVQVLRVAALPGQVALPDGRLRRLRRAATPCASAERQGLPWTSAGRREPWPGRRAPWAPATARCAGSAGAPGACAT